MKPETKIPLDEVLRLLNQRGKCEHTPEQFANLLWCWRRSAHRKTAGTTGWLSRRNTLLFLKYAYHHPK